MPLSTPTNRPSDLLELASLCRASYLGGSEAAAFVKPGYRGGAWQHAHENAFALVVDDGTHRIIVFRGSDDLSDWVGNFRFSRHPVTGDGNGRYVHSGFAAHLELLWNFVYGMSVTGQKVILTGHSLGGAVAIAAGARFMRNNDAHRISSIVTFAGPRVTSPQLALELQQAVKVTRVVNHGDWVDNLPPRFGRIKFEHCGAVVHLSRDGDLNTETPTIRQQAWWYARQWMQWGSTSAPLDHSMEEYSRRLGLAVGGQ